MLTFSRIPFSLKEETYIFSLNSYIEGYPSIASLDPLTHTDTRICVDEEVYDAYCNNLWNQDPYVRKDLLLCIIFNLYYGNDVIILIYDGYEYNTYLAETLGRYIRDVYGYISNTVSSLEDIENCKEGNFSNQGLFQIDMDLDWYRSRFGVAELPNDPPYD